ncbi:MAG TPA: 4-hydroxy-tetrahydrodipicolinate reductase [Longimicrobiales bacterium]|nr:4-hydroxy-tetrahydrodipicolinate reductase [Longimicrobiales bacterium]
MTRIVIAGIRGRMGRTLLRLAEERPDVEVTGGLASAADASFAVPVVSLDDAAGIVRNADVVIDFSTARATGMLLERAVDVLDGRALVVGTTGLDEAARDRLEALAARTAVLTAANFSVGVNLLLGLTARVAAALDAASYDIEIVEAHHRRKVDAPSGTALALGEAAAAGRGVPLAGVRRDGRSGETGVRPAGEIGIHALRGGGIIGEHRVVFAGERERIELVHEALDRAVFADGALKAATWIAGRGAGRFTMQDVLGLQEPGEGR